MSGTMSGTELRQVADDLGSTPTEAAWVDITSRADARSERSSRRRKIAWAGSSIALLAAVAIVLGTRSGGQSEKTTDVAAAPQSTAVASPPPSVASAGQPKPDTSRTTLDKNDPIVAAIISDTKINLEFNRASRASDGTTFVTFSKPDIDVSDLRQRGATVTVSVAKITSDSKAREVGPPEEIASKTAQNADGSSVYTDVSPAHVVAVWTKGSLRVMVAAETVNPKTDPIVMSTDQVKQAAAAVGAAKAVSSL